MIFWKKSFSKLFEIFYITNRNIFIYAVGSVFDDNVEDSKNTGATEDVGKKFEISSLEIISSPKQLWGILSE